MGSAHRIHYDLYRGEKVIADPGDGGAITVTEDLQICELVSGATAETRTLTNPTKPGIRVTIRVKTDGGGAITLTAANGLNASLETEATLADAGDLLELLSVSTATGYRWETLVNTGTVVSSASPSATPSASPSATPSASPSATPSSSPSAT